MYTPFRLKPRIFPAVVSATVAVSEAMTVLGPQPVAADFVFGGASGVGCASAVAGKIAEPANPAPKVAIAPIKERRCLNADPASRFNFDVIPTPSQIVQRRDPRLVFVARNQSSFVRRSTFLLLK